MSVDPRKYIEIDKRFPDSMTGDANRVVTVKADESGYQHSGAITVEHLVGSVLMWPLDTPPQGYLICDGAEYDIATYPALGALLGENAPGSGKFNVPDISFAKNSKGVNTGTKEAAEVGEHDHGAMTELEGEHGHNMVTDSAGGHGHSAGSGGGHSHSCGSVGNHTHSYARAYIKNTGQAGSSNEMRGDANTQTGGAGAHSHSIGSVGGHGHSIGTSGAHTHTATVQQAGEHSHKIPSHGVGEETQPACTLLNFCIRT